jgi:hypothetical protein
MSLNLKMEKILRTKRNLEKKSLSEGLTKRELSLLSEIKSSLREAPIDYEGPERMEPGIERKITSKETPYNKHPAMPGGDRDFVELVSSKRFKDSVDKVRRYLGDTTALQGRNPLMNLMGMAMGGLQQITRIESQNKEYLENLAIDLVKKELGIPKGALQFDAKLVHGGMGAAEGMRTEPQEPEKEDVEDAFKKAEEHKEDLLNFADSFEQFNLEKAKRRFINSLIQGAAFKGGHMYVLVGEELNRLDPQLLNLYGVTQSIMEHMYWIYPDMEAMAGSGGGQMGQSEVDEETDPPTVKARAATFPLLIHELVKGVYEVFGTHGLPDDPKQQELVMNAEDTLPAEIWDSRLGPVFWEKLQDAYPVELFEDDMKHIQHYLFMRFSKLEAKEFFRVAKLILNGDPQGANFIQRMVNEIVSDLKKQDYEDSMSKGDDDDDDFNPDDVDLSSLGL